MTKTELMTLPVYSPFTDKYIDCICKMELQFEDNGKFLGGNLYEVITDADTNLMDYLNDDKLDDVEQLFLERVEL